MAPSTMMGGEPALVTQCQALASMGHTISFSLALGSTFSLNLDTRRKATSPGERRPQKKKPSPSTLRRNQKRKEKFLKQKGETTHDLEVSSPPEGTFKCEHCDNFFKSENGLKIYIGKYHKTLKEVLSPEKVREDSKETSLSLSPVRDTNREEKVMEEEEEAPALPEEVIVQRHFSIESLCTLTKSSMAKK